MAKIIAINARQVLDSRGNPTVEADVFTEKFVGSAMVPSGASTGVYEALELRDGGKVFGGKGVLKAVNNVKKKIAPKLGSMTVTNQSALDKAMLKLDGTKNKSKLGANAILAVSLAAARAAAASKSKFLFEYLADMVGNKKFYMPIPFANVINGGKHAGGKLPLQEFMLVPTGAKSFTEATQMVAETYHILKGVIKKKYGPNAVNVGDEGGFAPPIDTADQALSLMSKAISESGYKGKIKMALDPAASEFYVKGKYIGMKPERFVDFYVDLVKKYPIVSLEDPFDQDDFESFQELTKRIGRRVQIMGDDLTVTNVERMKKCIKLKACNALLVKVNQIGSLTETIDAVRLACENDWHAQVANRSGETEDPFIADLAVAMGNGQIKLGAPCRSDRCAKYNQLIRIEEYLGRKATYAGKMMFR